MSKIFGGIKVLDFSTNVAGPAATAMLADHGAEIIKIERPVVGDDIRGYSPRLHGLMVSFIWMNRGKKSIVLDLNDPQSIEIIKKIIADVDLVVESFRPGVMKKFGLDYEEVKKIKPEIVYCSVSAFGQNGPYHKKPGYDLIAQALSGFMDMTGSVDGPPQKSGFVVGDYVGSLTAYGAIVSALFHQKMTGEGQYVDVSLLEGLVGINSNIEIASAMDSNPSRLGNHHSTMCPYGLFMGNNKQSAIIAAPNNKMWELLCNTIGKPELANDPEFDSGVTRCKNLYKVVDILEEWLKTFEDIQDAVDILEKAGIPSCKVATTRDLLTDKHLAARGTIVDIPTPLSVAEKGTKTIKGRGPSVKFSKTPVEIQIAPDLGQYNHEILSKYGLELEEIDDLEQKWIEKVKNK